MKKIDVCYASSDEFTIHTGISLLSLLDNNQGIIGRAFFLDYGMTDASKDKLRGVCREYDVECIFIWAKDKLIEIGEQTGIKNFRDSFATYSRAFIDILMPEDVDEFLYIDSDTVVVGSIAPLAELDMTDKAICGCANSFFYGRKRDGSARSEELNLLSGNHLYLHCGVLWYSLKNWKRFNCTAQIMETTKKMDHYRFADQTLINNALDESLFALMPLVYDASLHNYCDKYNTVMYGCGDFYSKEEIKDAIKRPVIIHYCGGPLARPWFDVCQSRLKQPYYDYKARSPWKDVPLQIAPKPSSKKERLRHKLTVLGMHTNSYFLLRVIGKVKILLCGR